MSLLSHALPLAAVFAAVAFRLYLGFSKSAWSAPFHVGITYPITAADKALALQRYRWSNA
jgi:hypothetical protein